MRIGMRAIESCRWLAWWLETLTYYCMLVQHLVGPDAAQLRILLLCACVRLPVLRLVISLYLRNSRKLSFGLFSVLATAERRPTPASSTSAAPRTSGVWY